MIGRPYLYTRKSMNFAFSLVFLYQFIYILDHVTSASHTPPTRRRYRPSTRRRTPKKIRAYPRLSLSFQYPPKPLSISFSPNLPLHRRSCDIGIACTDTQLLQILGNRRKFSQSLGDLQIFDLFIG